MLLFLLVIFDGQAENGGVLDEVKHDLVNFQSLLVLGITVKIVSFTLEFLSFI